MNKEKVNELLKIRGIICENDDEYVENFRETYKKIIGELNENDFYNSMVSWWNDGSAPYYNNYLKRVWKD